MPVGAYPAKKELHAADAPHLFFIAGGALAVENAIKASVDWKVRKNFSQ